MSIKDRTFNLATYALAIKKELGGIDDKLIDLIDVSGDKIKRDIEDKIKKYDYVDDIIMMPERITFMDGFQLLVEANQNKSITIGSKYIQNPVFSHFFDKFFEKNSYFLFTVYRPKYNKLNLWWSKEILKSTIESYEKYRHIFEENHITKFNNTQSMDQIEYFINKIKDFDKPSKILMIKKKNNLYLPNEDGEFVELDRSPKVMYSGDIAIEMPF